MSFDPRKLDLSKLDRRTLLWGGLGVGGLGLAAATAPFILGLGSGTSAGPAGAGAGTALSADSGGVLKVLHTAPRAKRIIWLYMAGGPSHVDLFDPKPELIKRDGQGMPESLTKGQQLAQLQGQELKVKAPVSKFRKYGQSGIEMSEFLPFIGANVADKMTLIRTMRTEQINHDPAHTFMNTGGLVAGRPCLGSWLHYGLGAKADDLPPFIVMVTGSTSDQPVSSRQWHSGFLPTRYQGVEFQSGPQPVYYLSNPGVDDAHQREVLEHIAALNALALENGGDPETATRTAAYDLARRMQSSLPKLADLDHEPEHVKKLYGIGGPNDSFARNCLLARKMAERDVSLVQLYFRGWDHHSQISSLLPFFAEQVDRASAALVLDLEQRGMLEDTLVIWGGEFGRTPMAQGDGRDHHIKCFSLWMAGGGVRPGYVHGVSDDFGYATAENEVHVHDLHATILHLMGIDHERLTYRFQGRDFRLTDVHGHVVEPMIA